MEERIEAVIRFNVFVTGILATGASVLARARGSADGVEIPLWQEGLFLMGSLLLVVSTAWAVLAYLKPTVAAGIDAEGLDQALRYDVTRAELLREVIHTYRRGILLNEEVMELTARRFRWALLSLLGALAALAVATGTFLVEGGA